MAFNRQRLEEGRTEDDGSEPNASSTDEELSALARGPVEFMVIRVFRRCILPTLTPMFRRVVREEMQELVTSMKENPAKRASTTVPKKLKLQFRNKIQLPVFTGKRLVSEIEKTIDIALVDALTNQIVKTGIESTAKVEIVGFRVGDDESNDDNWTVKEFQKRIMSEKKGKRNLQGNTSLQLKEGVCSVDNISFTHSSENTKNGMYRLGVGVVDTALMNKVEVATTEAFPMKDARATYYAKHPHPLLKDKVCHLRQISYKGKNTRYEYLKKAKVNTVKDLLILLHTDSKELEKILKVKAGSKIWDDIVSNAQMSNGMFLWLDPSNEGKSGVVLDAKLHLKGLIAEPLNYIPVNHLSHKQKTDNQNFVKFASQRLKTLDSFEDEASLIKHLQSETDKRSLPPVIQSLGSCEMIDEPIIPSSVLNSSSPILHTESPHNLNMVTSESEKGKEKVPFEEVTIYTPNYNQDHISNEAPNNHFTGSCSLPVESAFNTDGHINYSPDSFQGLLYFPNYDFSDSPNYEWPSEPTTFDNTNVVMVAAQTVSVCTNNAQTRWTKVSKLLRRLSVRERIGLPEGIQPHKKQRCG